VLRVWNEPVAAATVVPVIVVPLNAVKTPLVADKLFPVIVAPDNVW
jgi:phosphoribosylcarboxyaminoimidazole (NCAIR) mutase